MVQGKYAEAETLLLQVLESKTHVLGQDHHETIQAINYIIELYEAWKKPDKAETYRAMLSSFD